MPAATERQIIDVMDGVWKPRDPPATEPLPDRGDVVDIRADIVAALSAVRVDRQGKQITLRPHEYGENTRDATPFTAWPEWRADNAAGEDWHMSSSWSVIVVLPAEDAQSWTEALRRPVHVALGKLGRVDRTEPVTIAAGDATVPAIRYALTTTVYYAHCMVCGWQGPDRHTKLEAHKDAQPHSDEAGHRTNPAWM